MSCLKLIVNPIAGSFSNNKLKKAIDFFKKYYSEVSVLYTSKKGDTENFCKKFALEGEKMIVVVGGDGTFNEAANGVALSETAIGFIPAGTSNVFARELGIAKEYKEAAKQIINATPKKIHLGVINNRYFLLMAGIGFDGEAVYKVNPCIKRFSGKGAYILSGFKVLIKTKLKIFTIEADGKVYKGYSAVICNSAYYGGNFRICPDASVFSDKLHICIMHNCRRKDLIKYIIGIISSKHLNYSDITYTTAKEIFIYGDDSHIQIDGDYFGILPVKITIKKYALKILF